MSDAQLHCLATNNAAAVHDASLPDPLLPEPPPFSLALYLVTVQLCKVPFLYLRLAFSHQRQTSLGRVIPGARSYLNPAASLAL